MAGLTQARVLSLNRVYALVRSRLNNSKPGIVLGTGDMVNKTVPSSRR